MARKEWLTEYAIGGKVVVQADAGTVSVKFGQGPVSSFNPEQSMSLREALECGVSSYYASEILDWVKDQGFPLKPIQYTTGLW